MTSRWRGGACCATCASLFPTVEAREARNGVEALAAFAAFQPDLLFLDVEMPEMTGLDVLRQLDRPAARIVFVTAYPQFAVEAFEANACDYLVKPFTAARFRAAVERAIAQLDTEVRLRELDRALSRSGRHLERLALRLGERLLMVDLADVRSLLSRDHYTWVHTADREYICTLSLLQLEERLDPKRFVRVHRNAIVQLAHVRGLHGTDAPHVELDNGQRVAVSPSQPRGAAARPPRRRLRAYCTITVPTMPAPKCGAQKYSKRPAWLNLWL